MATNTNLNRNSKGPDDSGGAVPIEFILCTDELKIRPPRPPNYEKESRALIALARALAESPPTILQELVDTILDVCQAGSAGISLLTKEDGGKRFYWPAIAGQWKGQIGGGTPRDFGPCGDVLDRNASLLMHHVERRYTYLAPVKPALQEVLLVPFYVRGQAVGTIWAVAHDDRKFDLEDERLMRSLSQFASSAYQTLETLDTLNTQAEHAKKGEKASALLASIVDSSDDAIISKSNDGLITSWNRGAERLFGYTAEEATGKHITFLFPPDRLEEEAAILQRVNHGEKVDHYETFRVRKDGTNIAISAAISPVKNAKGEVIGGSIVARDITERKQVEKALQEGEERLRTLADGLESQVLLRTEEIRQGNLEILEQSKQLRELSRRLVQSQDEERRRIARELHDSAGQIMTALGLHLAVITQGALKPEVRRAAQESLEMVRQLSNEIRTVSYLLHPPLLDENGLPEAIRWYAKGLENRGGFKIDLDIPEEFGRLPQDLEVAIFRIVQECLTNIHRHAGARTVTIRMTHKAQEACLEIQDDGAGIPDNVLARIRTQRSGAGMTGIQERVRHLGGSLDIESGPGGTKILVAFPLSTVSAEAEEITGKARAAGELI